MAIALAHINRPPPPLPADVPPAVRLLVERALAKDPADRFPDGGAFAEAIRRVAAGGTLAAAAPPAAPRRPPPRSWPAPRRPTAPSTAVARRATGAAHRGQPAAGARRRPAAPDRRRPDAAAAGAPGDDGDGG